jgi:hypothetical protein
VCRDIVRGRVEQGCKSYSVTGHVTRSTLDSLVAGQGSAARSVL